MQQAVVTVLNAIYEEDFLGFSYGFRRGRSQHDALDALAVGVKSRKVNWILDSDIRSFFDEIDHGWMLKFLEHRHCGSQVVGSDPQVAQGWSDRQREQASQRAGDTARCGRVAAAGEHLSARTCSICGHTSGGSMRLVMSSSYAMPTTACLASRTRRQRNASCRL